MEQRLLGRTCIRIVRAEEPRRDELAAEDFETVHLIETVAHGTPLHPIPPSNSAGYSVGCLSEHPAGDQVALIVRDRQYGTVEGGGGETGRPKRIVMQVGDGEWYGRGRDGDHERCN
jgi:hypothetical protein